VPHEPVRDDPQHHLDRENQTAHEVDVTVPPNSSVNEREGRGERETDGETDTQTETHTDRHTGTQAHRHTDTQTHRHTDTQTETQRCAVILYGVGTTRARSEQRRAPEKAGRPR
jgi:hypothetical protein